MNEIFARYGLPNIDPIIIFFVLGSGFLQERMMSRWVWSRDGKFDSALKTFVVSFLVCIVYIFIVYYDDRTNKLPVRIYFISYFAATSFYELLIRPLRKAMQRYAKSEDEVKTL